MRTFFSPQDVFVKQRALTGEAWDGSLLRLEKKGLRAVARPGLLPQHLVTVAASGKTLNVGR
jgi:hypothetical protein